MATNSWNFTTRATWLVETPTLCADWPTAALHILQLVTCSLSAILLSSSRLISSSLRWGPFSCCLTSSAAAFLCCWEREGDRKQRNEHGDSACAEELTCLRVNSLTKREQKNSADQLRVCFCKSLSNKKKNTHTHLLHFVCMHAGAANLIPERPWGEGGACHTSTFVCIIISVQF